MSPISATSDAAKASPVRKRPVNTAPKERRHAHPIPQRHPGVGEQLAEPVLDVLVLGVVVLAVQLLEGGLVALVQEEQLALVQHLVEQAVEQIAPLRPG